MGARRYRTVAAPSLTVADLGGRGPLPVDPGPLQRSGKFARALNIFMPTVWTRQVRLSRPCAVLFFLFSPAMDPAACLLKC